MACQMDTRGVKHVIHPRYIESDIFILLQNSRISLFKKERKQVKVISNM